MLKSQLIIICTGIVAVILLFSLPKIIVKSDKQLTEATEQKAEPKQKAEPESQMKNLHKAELSEKESTKINNWRKSFSSVSNTEKKTNFADSLISAFRKVYLYDSAAKYAEQVAILKPTVAALVKTADIYMEAFNFATTDDAKQASNEKAREYYNKALKIQPSDLEVKSKVALTYIGSENPMQGIKILREVLQADPKNESALYNLGVLSIQSGQHDKAVARFEELLKVNPKHSAGQFYLGVAQANLGNKEKAVEAFKKARLLDSDPEFRSMVDSYLKELQ
jgi:outer membrane protein